MAPLRIAVGRLWQESNDLSTAPTTADDWRANAVLHGGEIAALVGFMASRGCSFTTGFCFDATGGGATY